MKTGDRVKLSGGYDMEPRWLQGGNGYFASVLGFIENNDEKRSTDGQLSALVEFDNSIDFDGLAGKFGLLDLRYKNQLWEFTGSVHVTLLKNKIESIKEKNSKTSRWMESHAHYKIINESHKRDGLG